MNTATYNLDGSLSIRLYVALNEWQYDIVTLAATAYGFVLNKDGYRQRPLTFTEWADQILTVYSAECERTAYMVGMLRHLDQKAAAIVAA